MKKISMTVAATLFFLLSITGCSGTSPGSAIEEGERESFLETDNEIEPINAYYLGHSLISDISDMAMSILNDAQPGSFDFDEQEIPGCPLHWHWNETQSGGQDEFTSNSEIKMRQLHEALDSGDYSHIVVTDSVPRGGEDMEAETADYLGRILARAREARADVRVYYYETWHHRDSGTPERVNDPEEQATGPNPNRELAWLPRLEADAQMWMSIVDTVNEADPPGPEEYPVRLIPAGRILGDIVVAAEEGSLPGMQGIEDIFGVSAVFEGEDQVIDDDGNPVVEPDYIHLSNYGKYAVACIHAAVLSLQDPVGYTSDVYDIHGGSYWNNPNWFGYVHTPPHSEAVAAIQEIVRDGLIELYHP